MGNTIIFKRNLLSTCITAFTLSAIGSCAYAADTTKPEAEEVVVTGSRIISSSFTQPTPTTSLTEEDLQKSAQPNVFTSIAQLPSLQGSTGTQAMTYSTSSGLQGLSAFSLRGLEAKRTLTLLDGQRVVPANVTGVADISQFPQLLLKSVDVVTGGASASYGSDAIGGVVNFITDKKFEGFKANIQGGQSTYSDNQGLNVQAAWGTSFFDNKLHLAVSGEHGTEEGIPIGGFGLNGPGGRSWYTGTEAADRPTAQTNDGKPQRILIDRAQNNQYARFGLITGGPLKGTAFNESGTPYAFQYGTNCVNNLCEGGDLSALNSGGKSLASELTRDVGYVRLGFDLNDDNEIYATINKARVVSYNEPIAGHSFPDSLTIQCSNAYLPASIQARCADPDGNPLTQDSITSFKFGTMNVQIPEFQKVHPTRTQSRYVIGADGKFGAFGTEWKYDAYYQYGKNVTDLVVHDILLKPRYAAAIDAIQGPNNTIICRDANARASGCVPMNIFGNFAPSEAAYNYVFPKNGPHQHTPQTQNVASFNVTGEPFSSWAGPIAIATGLEYRREAYSVTGDSYGDGTIKAPNTPEYPADTTPGMNTVIGNNWFAGNYHSAKGGYNVKEGYLELNVPVLDSDAFGEANINLADRETKYSTAGKINTWKVGGTWKTPVSGLRFRTVKSKDVRAPNLSEIYAAEIVTNIQVNDNGLTRNVQQRAIGNEKLRPEIATSNEFGIVLTQPDWAPGFSASADYFDIQVNGVISSLGAQQEVDLCKAGNQDLCSAMDLTGAVPYVRVQAFNLASMHNIGYDLETSYKVAIGDGNLTLRALASHTISFWINSGVLNTIPSNVAGVNSREIAIPDWKVLVSQSWDTDKWGATLTERWISGGVYSNEFIECQTDCPVSNVFYKTTNNNHIDSYLVFDLGGTYKLSENMSLYAKVDNLFNKAPPVSPGSGAVANGNLYDLIGRMYRVGLRVSF